MTRRLTLALVGMVLATLVLAGIGTLVLTGIGARRAARDDVAAQATSTAELVELGRGRTGTLTPAQQQAVSSGICAEPIEGTTRRSDALRTLCRSLDARATRREQVTESLQQESISLVTVYPDGRVEGTLPDGLTAERLTSQNVADATVVGNTGGRVFASAPLAPGESPAELVVITRSIDPVVRRAAGWFLLSAIVTLAVAVVVAALLSRRLTRPVLDATVVTGRLAAGDLGARLVEHRTPGATPPGDEVEQLAHSINTMAENLERSRGLERQFLMSISHDLRTPLTSIRGYAEAIMEGASPDPAAAAEVILGEARRLEVLVRDLLDLARLDARQLTVHPGPVDVGAVARDRAEGLRREVEGLGLRLELDIGDDVVAWADRDRLAQVVANLVENAIKFASSTVTVRARPTPLGAVIEVADDGEGIAPIDLPHVFERLYVTGAEPKRKETGSGLGLAIVAELVTAMGGTVIAGTEPGGGARLSVQLPPPPPGSGTTTPA